MAQIPVPAARNHYGNVKAHFAGLLSGANRDRTGDLLLAKLGGTFSTRCHTLPKPEITAKSVLDVCHTLPLFATSACSLDWWPGRIS
jgi:hypothetical protein